MIITEEDAYFQNPLRFYRCEDKKLNERGCFMSADREEQAAKSE